MLQRVLNCQSIRNKDKILKEGPNISAVALKEFFKNSIYGKSYKLIAI